jgi:hypothetical protein
MKVSPKHMLVKATCPCLLGEHLLCYIDMLVNIMDIVLNRSCSSLRCATFLKNCVIKNFDLNICMRY